MSEFGTNANFSDSDSVAENVPPPKRQRNLQLHKGIEVWHLSGSQTGEQEYIRAHVVGVPSIERKFRILGTAETDFLGTKRKAGRSKKRLGPNSLSTRKFWTKTSFKDGWSCPCFIRRTPVPNVMWDISSYLHIIWKEW